MIPAPLLVVTDRHGASRPLGETVRAVLDGGARWVWFRDRDWELGARRAAAVELLALVRGAGGRLTIGSDVELAAAIGADGVHLSGSVLAEPKATLSHQSPHLEVPASAGLEGALQDPPRVLESSFEAADSQRHLRMRDGVGEAVASARSRLGAHAFVGLSAHSLADIRAATEGGADYVTLSPIFATASKPGYGPALGLDALRAASAIGIPVVALGGIGPSEARACRDAGAAGIAVMGGLMRADDPAAAARALLEALGQGLAPASASAPTLQTTAS